jgi:hypothetical protein
MITLDDYTKPRDAENGGVEAVVVIKACDIDRTSSTIADGVITALVLNESKKGYTWTPDLEQAMATDNATGNRTNNSYFKTHTLMVVFTDDASTTAALAEDAGRTNIVALVKYATPPGEDAKWKAFGFLNGLRLTTEEASTGQLYEDLRGHTLNFEGKELTRALSIAEGLVDAVLVPAS